MRVIHYTRRSAVRRILSWDKLVGTGQHHERGFGAPKAEVGPGYSYNVTPVGLAAEVLDDIHRASANKQLIAAALPAGQTTELHYEDLMDQSPGSTWEDVSKFVGAKHLKRFTRSVRHAASHPMLLRSMAANKTCAELCVCYDETERLLLRKSASDQLMPADERRDLAFAIADCRRKTEAGSAIIRLL